MNRLQEWKQIFKLAMHIHKNLPPKDDEWHAISFNIKLQSPRSYKEEKRKVRR